LEVNKIIFCRKILFLTFWTAPYSNAAPLGAPYALECLSEVAARRRSEFFSARAFFFGYFFLPLWAKKSNKELSFSQHLSENQNKKEAVHMPNSLFST
jgi:hypothetical protein